MQWEDPQFWPPKDLSKGSTLPRSIRVQNICQTAIKQQNGSTEYLASVQNSKRVQVWSECANFSFSAVWRYYDYDNRPSAHFWDQIDRSMLTLKQRLAWPSNLGQAILMKSAQKFHSATRWGMHPFTCFNGLRSFAGKCWNAKGPTMPLPVLPEPFPNAKPWEAAQTLREKIKSCTNTELSPFSRHFSYLSLSFLTNANVVSETFHQHLPRISQHIAQPGTLDDVFSPSDGPLVWNLRHDDSDESSSSTKNVL